MTTTNWSFGELTDKYDRDDRCTVDPCAKCGEPVGDLPSIFVCYNCEIWGTGGSHDIVVPWDARELVPVLDGVVENPKKLVRDDRKRAEELANEVLGVK